MEISKSTHDRREEKTKIATKRVANSYTKSVEVGKLTPKMLILRINK